MPRFFEGQLSAAGLEFAIIVSRFNEFITERLLDGAVDALLRHGADDEAITVYRVPGSFEVPLMAHDHSRDLAGDSSLKPDAPSEVPSHSEVRFGMKRPQQHEKRSTLLTFGTGMYMSLALDSDEGKLVNPALNSRSYFAVMSFRSLLAPRCADLRART